MTARHLYAQWIGIAEIARRLERSYGAVYAAAMRLSWQGEEIYRGR